MNIDHEPKLDFDDVLLVPQRSQTASRKDVVLEREFKFFHSPRTWTGIPIVVSNMDTTGSFAMGRSLSKHKIITALHKFYTVKQLIDFFRETPLYDYVWPSLGMKDGDLQKVIEFAQKIGHQPNLVIDVANGYTDDFILYLSKVRKHFPKSIIMAGNVCTAEMVPEYILHGGVDIVKIGIGPGSVCTTRIKTGCGYPQLSAIDECSYKAHGLKSAEKRLGLICGDGGCKNSGDIAKGFAANADFMMVGGLLAGVDECEGIWSYEPFSGKKYYYCAPNSVITTQSPYRTTWPEGFIPSSHQIDDYQSVVTYNKTLDGQVIEPPKKLNLKFHGMSSKEAMERHHGGMSEYKSPEGKQVTVQYKGTAEEVILPILGGIRSACSMIGAKSLKEISRCAHFVKVNRTHNTVFGD